MKWLRKIFGRTSEQKARDNAARRDKGSPKSGGTSVTPDERRARNLAKLEARKAEAAAKHRQLMATKPGARS